MPAARSRSVPITPPLSLVNGVSLRAFNALYFAVNARQRGPALTHYVPFFYPLDAMGDWNRIYGPRGFYQYQCVVPRAAEREATRDLLRAIGDSGTGSFLAVLKTFGERTAPGRLSVPIAGTTLALFTRLSPGGTVDAVGMTVVEGDDDEPEEKPKEKE